MTAYVNENVLCFSPDKSFHKMFRKGRLKIINSAHALLA